MFCVTEQSTVQTDLHFVIIKFTVYKHFMSTSTIDRSYLKIVTYIQIYLQFRFYTAHLQSNLY